MAEESKIEPIVKFTETVRNHFDGIMRYFTSKLTSGAIEGLNSRIQNIKRKAPVILRGRCRLLAKIFLLK